MEFDSMRASQRCDDWNTAETVVCLCGGPLFDGVRWYEDGHVVIENGRVAQAGPGTPENKNISRHDVDGRIIAPGLVDLHSDSLEKCIEIRPGARFDPAFALQNLDVRLIGNGITTFCHAVSIMDADLSLRSPESAEAIIREIAAFSVLPAARARHRVHIRYEIGSERAMRMILDLFDTCPPDVFSIMDHSPGQGQFRTMELFCDFYSKSYSITRSEAERIGIERSKKTARDWEMVVDLITKAHECSISTLSHDDDTGQKINMVREMGIDGCEFPVTMEAAREAHDAGLRVFMGAPNLIRGVSNTGNVSAGEVLDAELCNGLISDYAPETLLQAPFAAMDRHGLSREDAFAMVTSGPGSFLRSSTGAGTLLPGSPADIAVIEPNSPWARVRETWVGGVRVYRAL